MYEVVVMELSTAMDECSVRGQHRNAWALSVSVTGIALRWRAWVRSESDLCPSFLRRRMGVDAGVPCETGAAIMAGEIPYVLQGGPSVR